MGKFLPGIIRLSSAWLSVGGQAKFRQELADGRLLAARAEALVESLEEVLPALREQLDKLPADELLAFDRILERKLYDIDRSEIQQYTDGSDDGFLYARGFIVAAGKGYYDAVNANPAIAVRSPGGRSDPRGIDYACHRRNSSNYWNHDGPVSCATGSASGFIRWTVHSERAASELLARLEDSRLVPS